MADSSASYESSFSEWLAKKVSPAQLSAIYLVFTDINDFCLSRKILKKPLFETDDLVTLTNVQETVECSKVFAFSYRKQKSIMIAAIRHYCRFIKEAKDKNSLVEPKRVPSDKPESTEQEITENNSLYDFLVANNISFIDNRQKNGCLWMIGGKELKIFADKCFARGVTFHFKADGARATGYSSAWWTTDDFNSSAKSDVALPVADNVTVDKPSLAVSSEKSNRSRFIEWLNKRGISSGVIFVTLSSLKRCTERVKAEKIIDDDIYHVVSAETMDAVRSFLLADKDFIYADCRKGNQLTNALNLYLEFFDEQLSPTIVEVTGKPEPEMDFSAEMPPQPLSEIEVLLNEGVFLPLKLALEKENIRTIEDLRALKLWAFMNQNNLYSISMRQTVLAKVRRLLEPVTAGTPELLYELHCGSTVYSGDTVAKTFLHFCEDTAQKYPLFFRTLLDKTIDSTSDVKIYRSPGNGNFIRMENPTCYVSADLTKDSVIAAVEWIIQRCMSSTVSVSIKEPDSRAEMSQEELPDAAFDEQNEVVNLTPTLPLNAPEPSELYTSDTVSAQESESVDSGQIAKAEKIVLDADMNGVTYDGLHNALHLTIAATKALVQQCKRIVEIKGKLYHEDAFVDWNDGAKQICLIMEKLMQKNNGYISAVQLYDYARVEMNMFLNDNDVNDERAIYEIAQHLFEKNSFEGHHYSFVGKAHISKSEDAISSTFDIICKFAEDRGGMFREDALTEYLTSIGIKAGNLRNQMRLGKEPVFFFYEPGTIISAKSIGIDDSWKESVGRALNNLLSDADDHIVLRQIQPVWYESLPALPKHRCWTPLLLQYILRFYGKEFGAKTIMAMKLQSMDTLHAMLVKADSPIQNFGDAVIAYLVESETEQRSFAAEELRQLLVKSGMIQGNELIWNMPKALEKDERFAWDAKGENVTVRV